MPKLVWFRNDLRIHDNPALHRACCESDDGVVGVFIACGKQWLQHDWGANKVSFVLRSVQSLAEELASIYVPLKFIEEGTFSKVTGALLTLAKKHKVTGLYFNREYEVNELLRDESVRDAFETAEIEVCVSDDQAAISPDVIKTGKDTYYKVYTPYFKAWQDAVKEQLPVKPLRAPGKQKKLSVSPDSIPEMLRSFGEPIHASEVWPVGETEAKRRLRRFIKQSVEDYKNTRDFPASESTSVLSPYLACGAISVRTCLGAAIDANDGEVQSGKKGIDTWISQLAWRDFYRHVLVGYPRVSKNLPFRLETLRLSWSDNEERFEAWCEGQTGVPIVDAAMTQLLQTGWMHNRLRMIVAMYLTKDLFLDWRWGERFFMNHLIDGDLANNNGGWQWAASTGTDAAPYFRVFNPVRQSVRIDPDGEFIRQYIPCLREVKGREIHDPSPGTREMCGYPRPLVDHAEAKRRALEAFKALQK